MKRPSLRQRLLWFIGLPVLALWLVAGVWLGQRITHETGEMFDRGLERTAATVLALASTARESGQPLAWTPGTRPSTVRHEKSSRAEIVLRDQAGRVLLEVSSLPPLPVGPHAETFRTLTYAGGHWRVYQRWNAGHTYWIQVATPLHDLDQLRLAHLEATLVPVAVLLVLLPLAIWIGLRIGLAPVRAVSRAIAAEPEHTPILTRDDVPVELYQLTRAVDALTTRLDAALARERRFTADAAHELRHPLSVLRLELDLAGAADGVPARGHLERARTGLARMERLVDQLLTLARVENLAHVDDARLLAPAALAREVLAEASERAAPRGVNLTLHADEKLRVRGSSGLLAIALRNLVDNAILHGRARGQVNLEVIAAGDRVELAVGDDGPGISGTQAARLGERFARGADSHTGTGLGLSIARAIALLHGGDLVLGKSARGGARIALRLPLADPSLEPPG